MFKKIKYFLLFFFSLLRPDSSTLLDDLSYEQILTYIKPEEVKSSKKQRKVDMEVMDLKQKLNGAHSKQIVLSNREIRLLRYVLKNFVYL